MKKALFFVSLLVFVGCRREIEAKDVIKSVTISPREVFADGQSIISVSVVIDAESSEDRRDVIVSTSSGTFSGSGKSADTVKAIYENGILTAKAAILSPLMPGVVAIAVQQAFDSPIKDIIQTDSIVAKFSQPDTIYLIPSTIGISSNYLSEASLTAHLRSPLGNFVSNGVRVKWEDVFLSGLPAGGIFRNVQAVTKDSSKVGAVYSAQALPIGTKIKIRVTVLDADQKETDKKDSIYLIINQ